MKNIFAVFLLFCLLSSCSLQRMRYSKGFNIQLKNRHGNDKKEFRKFKSVFLNRDLIKEIDSTENLCSDLQKDSIPNFLPSPPQKILDISKSVKSKRIKKIFSQSIFRKSGKLKPLITKNHFKNEAKQNGSNSYAATGLLFAVLSILAFIWGLVIDLPFSSFFLYVIGFIFALSAITRGIKAIQRIKYDADGGLLFAIFSILLGILIIFVLAIILILNAFA